MVPFAKFEHSLKLSAFLQRYASDPHKKRWQQVDQEIQLQPKQIELLNTFRREMYVLCLTGAWCGDCSSQCPIFEHFARMTHTIRMGYLDRDDHPDVQKALRINGGNRVPVLVFFSEDGHEISRFGDRTLSRYRQMMIEQGGDSCPTGLVQSDKRMLEMIVQEWLNEFERVQWMLRLSPRLRQKHGD